MLPTCITEGGGGMVHFACAFYDGRSVRTAETCSFVFRVLGAILSLFKTSLTHLRSDTKSHTLYNNQDQT